jgi:hypothetical protein
VTPSGPDWLDLRLDSLPLGTGAVLVSVRGPAIREVWLNGEGLSIVGAEERRVLVVHPISTLLARVRVGDASVAYTVTTDFVAASGTYALRDPLAYPTHLLRP